MRKQLMIPALLAMSVALAACSTPPNANPENARTNFSALQSNPNANKVAALETKDARIGWIRLTRPTATRKTRRKSTNWRT
jgi:starvation-inducible outer membrane lipoprotein